MNNYPVNHICEFLDHNGIGYHVKTINDHDFIYIDHGAFGRPDGFKLKGGEFRPDFRISATGSKDTVYTKVCGCCSYMKLDQILETLSNW